jgi:glycosyltransferase involved in cell wall biosynthesis
MNILFLDQFGELGGAQRALLDLLPAVRERGWTACVTAPGQGPLLDQAHTLGASTEILPLGPYGLGRKPARDYVRFLADQPRLAAGIRRLVAREQCDLVYVNGPRLVPAAVLAARNRVPVLFHCHSRIHPRGASALVALALRRARCPVIACSNFVAAPLRRSASSLRVVYYGVPPGPVPRARAARRVGLIGRISPEKGHLHFLAAARVLARSVPGCRFVICGAPLFSGPAGAAYALQVQRCAEGLPVDFLGWRSDVGEVLSSLDLVVVPSSGVDATPRVILEAYAAGTPVVAFRAGGIPEVVEHGRTGYLVDPFPEALAAKIAELLRHDAAHLCELGARARQLWRERFTVERYQQEIVSLAASISRQK